MPASKENELESRTRSLKCHVDDFGQRREDRSKLKVPAVHLISLFPPCFTVTVWDGYTRRKKKIQENCHSQFCFTDEWWQTHTHTTHTVPTQQHSMRPWKLGQNWLSPPNIHTHTNSRILQLLSQRNKLCVYLMCVHTHQRMFQRVWMMIKSSLRWFHRSKSAKRRASWDTTLHVFTSFISSPRSLPTRLFSPPSVETLCSPHINETKKPT